MAEGGPDDEYLERSPRLRNDVEVDFNDVMTRAFLADLRVMELQLQSREKLIKHHVDKVNDLSASIRSLDPKSITSADISNASRQLESRRQSQRDHVAWLDATMERLHIIPMGVTEFDLEHQLRGDADLKRPTQVFLDKLGRTKLQLQTLWNIQTNRHKVSWREVDRAAQLKELDEELLDLEVHVQLPEFEKDFLEGRLKVTRRHQDVEQLKRVCFSLLEDCETRLKLVTWSLEYLTDYVETKWRQKTESHDSTAAERPKHLKSRAPEKKTSRKDQVCRRPKSFPFSSNFQLSWRETLS